MAKTEHLREIVNTSGYLFQERICEEIKSTKNRHAWQISTDEHRWTDEGGRERFIDVVLMRRFSRLVLEIKRCKEETNWIFLPFPGTNITEEYTHRLWTQWRREQPHTSQWEAAMVRPVSSVAKFCTVRGQGEDDSPMLERLGGVLLRATESVAGEELRMGTRQLYEDCCWSYFPVVVTNAKLHLCSLKYAAIDIETGKLPLDAQFNEIDFIRFTKSLSTSFDEKKPPRTLDESNQASQRTIFVVNGAKLSRFLEAFSFEV
jgi:hypothetical protein